MTIRITGVKTNNNVYFNRKHIVSLLGYIKNVSVSNITGKSYQKISSTGIIIILCIPLIPTIIRVSVNKQQYICNYYEKIWNKSRNLAIVCHTINLIYRKIYIMITQIMQGICSQFVLWDVLFIYSQYI